MAETHYKAVDNINNPNDDQARNEAVDNDGGPTAAVAPAATMLTHVALGDEIGDASMGHAEALHALL
eukprot:10944416-Lingulodinium_polyedra.AAC.1